MRINVLKSDLTFMGCPVYIRQFAHTFEYLLVYKGQIYSASVDLKPTKNKAGDITDYTADEQQNGVKMMWAMAQTTITELSKMDKKKKPHGRSKSQSR